MKFWDLVAHRDLIVICKAKRLQRDGRRGGGKKTEEDYGEETSWKLTT